METPPLERKLVAILAADVEGYSRMMHADEVRTLSTLTSHRKIIDDLIETARGHIAGTAGDSVLAEFASVSDAVGCAVAIQQKLATANDALLESEKMQFRIGINVGDVMVKDGDIFGDGVNIAARLEAMAPAGGICVTRGVRDQLRDRTAFKFADLGEQAVKNIARPVRVFQVDFDINGPSPLGNETLPEAQKIILEDTSPATADSTVEVAFWASVSASDSLAMREAYLEKYPDGEFASLAKIWIDEFNENAG